MKKLSVINQQFIEAARDNQFDELKNLLIQGADIHTDNDSALRDSARYGQLKVVKFLVTRGANVQANDDEALRWAAQYGYLDMVKFLIAQGADIHANNDQALKDSALRGHNDVWQVLSAFIQEKKLRVAAVGSTSASSWGCGMPVLPSASAGMPQTQPAKLKKSQRSKI